MMSLRRANDHSPVLINFKLTVRQLYSDDLKTEPAVATQFISYWNRVLIFFWDLWVSESERVLRRKLRMWNTFRRLGLDIDGPLRWINKMVSTVSGKTDDWVVFRCAWDLRALSSCCHHCCRCCTRAKKLGIRKSRTLMLRYFKHSLRMMHGLNPESGEAESVAFPYPKLYLH